MMQLREQIRKLLDRGYSLPFTGTETLHIHQHAAGPKPGIPPSLDVPHGACFDKTDGLRPHSSCFHGQGAVQAETFCNRLAAEFL